MKERILTYEKSYKTKKIRKLERKQMPESEKSWKFGMQL